MQLKKFVQRAIIALVLIGVGVIIGLDCIFKWDWVGFHGKTLWDWFNLLGVLAIPVVVGFGTVWLTAQQARVSNAENTDDQREKAFQAYMDVLSVLILDKGLCKSQKADEVRDVARVRTLATLRRLDGKRKSNVLQLLRESSLVKVGNAIIDLRGADFSGAVFHGADLRGAALKNVNFSGADFREANLSGSDLSLSNLSGADLRGTLLIKARLTNVDLTGAKVTLEQLEQTLAPNDAAMSQVLNF